MTKDENDEPIYDFEIDTSDITQEQAVDRIHRKLVQFGLVEENLDVFMGYKPEDNLPIGGN